MYGHRTKRFLLKRTDGHVQLPLVVIPQENIDQYTIYKLAHNGIIYVEIRNGMPGLNQLT